MRFGGEGAETCRAQLGKARLPLPYYYCHPYSAFERGSNENGNRMIRRRVPKGTDFTGITEADTLEVQRWVNEYPRGILGGRCAGRVLLELAQEAGIEGVELLL